VTPWPKLTVGENSCEFVAIGGGLDVVSASTGNRLGRGIGWGCLCLIVLAVVAITTWALIDSRRGWSVARLEASIAAEVPSGADRWTIEKWFDGHRISHDFLVDTTGDRSGHSTMPMLAGLRDGDLGGMVRGLIWGSEANVGFLESGRIALYFFFDKEGRLVGHLVDPFIYSL
jgi:hypothetical protein